MTARKLFVAIPAYTGAITVETAQSIYAELLVANGLQWGYSIEFMQQNPMIHYVRNYLCRRFLASDATDLIFIDADVGFPPGTLCRLASYPVGIVGAIYPHRADALSFPIRYIDERTELRGGSAQGTENILEVEGIPAGCMRISRAALEKIMEKFPANVYDDMEGQRTFSFFEFSKERGGFNGEDWHFCQLARDAGVQVWADPEVDMTHTGCKVFRGNLGAHLRGRDDPAGVDAAMANIMKFAGMEKAA